MQPLHAVQMLGVKQFVEKLDLVVVEILGQEAQMHGVGPSGEVILDNRLDVQLMLGAKQFASKLKIN